MWRKAEVGGNQNRAIKEIRELASGSEALINYSDSDDISLEIDFFNLNNNFGEYLYPIFVTKYFSF